MIASPLGRRPGAEVRPRAVLDSIVTYTVAFLIGSNALTYYSAQYRLAGRTILLVGLWFAIRAVSSRQGHDAFIRLLRIDVLLWMLLVALPLLFMLFADRSFIHSDWTNQIACIALFAIGLLIGNRPELGGALALAAFGIVVVSAAMNVYELLVQNNAWSVAPGRSAGWYVNPNISAATLALYGIVFYAIRDERYRVLDLPILVVMFVGVVTTFSRGGMILFCVASASYLLSSRGALGLLSAGRRIAVAAVGLLLAAWVAFAVVLPKLSLTEDAERRLASIQGREIVKDYGTDRAAGAVLGMRAIRKAPWTGVGVRTSLEMEEGPHNMFVGLAMDMGVAVPALFAFLILRWVWAGLARRNQMASAMSACLTGLWLTLYGLSSHNVLYEPASLIGVAIAVSAFWGTASRNRSSARGGQGRIGRAGQPAAPGRIVGVLRGEP